MGSAQRRAQWSQAKRERVEAAGRRRRIIFNDDTYELDREDANTPEGFLKRRLKPLAGTQVGTISWSAAGGWGDAPVYDCKVQPIYGDAHGGPPAYWSRIGGNVKALIEAGHCPLQLIIDFAHGNGMEMFASVRINDCHDSFLPGGLTIWKKQHPELMVDTTGMHPNFELYTSAQDYSHQEVRQRKLEVIEDICARYDVDGFELDFIRHPVFFSRTVRGLPVTADQVEIMTALMRRIRELTDASAARRGRPLLLAARVPDNFELSMNIGLDLKSWLEEDLLDIVIAGGGYAPFSLRPEVFVEACRPHGVLVYPCVNEGMIELLCGGVLLEPMRALAANWYRSGVDGLYFWNLGTPFEYKTGDDLAETRRKCYASLYEVGDPETLKGKDKLFCVDRNLPGTVIINYAHVSSLRPLPFTSKQGRLKEGVIGRVPLLVGDDLAAPADGGRLARAKLTIRFDDPAWKDLLLFRLGGEELTGGEFAGPEGESECTLTYDVGAPPLKTGLNFIEVAARHGVGVPDRPVQVSDVKLKVEYGADV